MWTLCADIGKYPDGPESSDFYAFESDGVGKISAQKAAKPL